MLQVCFTLVCILSHMALGLSTPAAQQPNTKNRNTNTINIPQTYRALVATNTGDSFAQVAQIQTLPTPTESDTVHTLEKDEILIRVHYAGVNGGCETFRARGEHAFESNQEATPNQPFGLGAEGVGVIAAMGSEVDAEEYCIGDAVCFVGSAFAEYSKCKANAMIWKIPEPKPEYVGLRISALTSCAMLEQTGKLQEGETVLITAAAGGAGQFAVQFAKLAGCTVIGTCGSERKVKVLKELGCDHVINYKEQGMDVAQEIQKLAPNGLDAAFEGVGGEMLQIALENLSEEGRLIQVGYISEYPHNPQAENESSKNEINASELFWKSQTIQRGKQTIYGNAWPRDFGAVAGSKGRVLELFAGNKLKSIVDDTKEFVGLESVSDAIQHMLSGNSIGKVIVKIP